MSVFGRRRAIVAAAALVTAAVLTACSPGTRSSSTPTAGGDGNPYHLIKAGQIRVASVGDLKPYSFTDADGKYTGFDVQLFEDVARRIGVKDVVFTGQDFSAILPAVDG